DVEEVTNTGGAEEPQPGGEETWETGKKAAKLGRRCLCRYNNLLEGSASSTVEGRCNTCRDGNCHAGRNFRALDHQFPK
ncbi:unnamed protein product, partial [Ectocarpus fasciculatus]